MEDKIAQVFKKYSKSVDTEYNVYNCLIEEDWLNIAEELVKLFCKPAVISSVCTCRNAEIEKDSLVPVYCHKCNAYVQTDL